MQTSYHEIRNYSAVLAEQYGTYDTPQRAKFEEEAYAFYSSQILLYIIELTPTVYINI